jgi:hypothetical protein
MKIIIVGIVGLAALVMSSWSSSGSSHAIAHAQAVAGSGTVLTVQSHEFLVRMANHGFATVAVRPSTHIVSADNRPLSLSSVRAGDHVSLTSNSSIQDLSQRTLSVHGLVDLSPDANDTPEVLVVRGSVSVLAVITKATHYADSSHATTSLSDVADGDGLALRGIYDANIGEMTQTSSVTRLGPILKRPTTHSGHR